METIPSPTPQQLLTHPVHQLVQPAGHSAHPFLPSQVQPEWRPGSDALAGADHWCHPENTDPAADTSDWDEYQFLCEDPWRIHYVGCSPEQSFKHANPFSTAVLILKRI